MMLRFVENIFACILCFIILLSPISSVSALHYTDSSSSDSSSIGKDPMAINDYVIVKFYPEISQQLRNQLAFISDKQLHSGKSLSSNYSTQEIAEFYKTNSTQTIRDIKLDSSLQETLLYFQTYHIQPLGRHRELFDVYKVYFDAPHQIDFFIIALETQAGTKYAHKDYKPQLMYDPNDIFYVDGSQNWFSSLGMEPIWEQYTGEGVTIAILDGNIQHNNMHIDLESNMWENEDEMIGDANHDGHPGLANIDDDGDGLIDEDSFGNSRYLNGGLPNPAWVNDIPHDDDENGFEDDIYGLVDTGDSVHATHVAGIAAASSTGNGEGIVGMAFEATIMPISFIEPWGVSTLDAFYYAVDEGADVINNSWGSDTSPTAIEVAQYALDNNVLLVNSGGNGAASGYEKSCDSFPASFSGGITVGANDGYNDPIMYYSHGYNLDVTAIGTGVISTLPYDEYGHISGTSMSSPFVAGLAALFIQAHPNITVPELQTMIRNTAEDTGATGVDRNSGHGRINPTELFSRTELVAVNIDSPNCSIESSNFTVRATMTGNNMEEYTLSVGIGETPDDFTHIITEQSPSSINNEPIASLNSIDYPIGTLILKLEATFNGQVYTDYSEIEITSALIGDQIFIDRDLSMNKSDPPDAPFENVLIELYDAPYPDGNLLQQTISDQNGNYYFLVDIETNYWLYIPDNQPQIPNFNTFTQVEGFHTGWNNVAQPNNYQIMIDAGEGFDFTGDFGFAEYVSNDLALSLYIKKITQSNGTIISYPDLDYIIKPDDEVLLRITRANFSNDDLSDIDISTIFPSNFTILNTQSGNIIGQEVLIEDETLLYGYSRTSSITVSANNITEGFQCTNIYLSQSTNTSIDIELCNEFEVPLDESLRITELFTQQSNTNWHYTVTPWVEISNVSDDTVTANNWNFSKGQSTPLTFDMVIEPQEKIIICKDKALFDNTYGLEGDFSCDLEYDITYDQDLYFITNENGQTVDEVNASNITLNPDIPESIKFTESGEFTNPIHYGTPGYILLPGDANQDGEANNDDLNPMHKHILGIENISTLRAFQNAAYISHCGIPDYLINTITTFDMNMIYKIELNMWNTTKSC